MFNAAKLLYRSIALRENLNRSVLNQKKREVDPAFPGKEMCKCTMCGRTALRIVAGFDWANGSLSQTE